ncbi:hypothetical protein E0493_13395 [Roseomonas sp. M0104]|uniref:Uncharacterized protein n=1 Tax=Teichococcus coralli TaxID=2545983 RepID=A0A845BE01_9PROT|nr:hypothetical protein [Pseudoroseomonas coralli]MXP64340.1 hypothetical protein [Pseudoroseomonas coralli]
MTNDAKKRQDARKQDGTPDDSTKLGTLTGMMTGHSTRDAETTRPGNKTTGPGDMGNLLKNQREEEG